MSPRIMKFIHDLQHGFRLLGAGHRHCVICQVGNYPPSQVSQCKQLGLVLIFCPGTTCGFAEFSQH